MRVSVALLLLSAVAPLGAQVNAAPTGVAATVDSIMPRRHGPFHYFLRSLILPGWGQAALDRKLTGGLFIAFEGVALGMALKANTELDFLTRTGSERVEDKRNERQDWLVLMAANHLFSALEAFVSANLYDFPGDLKAQLLPNGRTGLGIRIALPR